MKITTIFYSFTGITRGIAEKIHDELGGELIEIKTKEPYSKITAYTLGCYRARKGECDDIEEVSIDISDSDVIVIGTPVWAFRAAPAINTAVNALENCEGKKAIIFATCGGKGGETIPQLEESLVEKGLIISGKFLLDKDDVGDKKETDALISAVKSAGISG